MNGFKRNALEELFWLADVSVKNSEIVPVIYLTRLH